MIALTTAVDLIIDNGGRNSITDQIEERIKHDDWDDANISSLGEILDDSLDLYDELLSDDDEALFEGWRAISVSVCDLIEERIQKVRQSLLEREEVELGRELD